MSEVNSKQRIGFIGLGDLGGAIAGYLQTHGVQLTVFDLDPKARQRLVDKGATAAESVKAVGAVSDVVIVCLPHPDVLFEVCLGADGLIHSLVADSIVVDMSTSGPEAVRKVGAALAEKQIRTIEGPVGKGPPAAEKGDITIMMGGDRETCREVEWLFNIAGSDLYYCGPLGAGQMIKVANNLASCAAMALAAEAYALAAAGGADLDVLAEVLPLTAADSWHIRNTLNKKVLTEHNFDPLFKLKLARKDLRLAVAAATTYGAPSACARGALEWYDEGSKAGYDDLDQSAILLTTNPELKKA